MIRSLSLLLILLAAPALAAEDPTIADARKLWQTGKYAESLDAYNTLAEGDKLDARAKARIALGRADCLASQGEYDKAVEALGPIADAGEANADVLARRADLHFQRGHWDEAQADAEKSLEAEPDHVLARWVVGRLHEAKGELGDALKAYQAIVDRYNQVPQQYRKDADALVVIGQAAEKYYRAKARGEELGEMLNDVINEIYEQAIVTDENCWQAAWLEGRLFLAGYREGSAKKELARALRINPQAAEVHVTLGLADMQGYKLNDGRRRAQQALEINPHYAPAHVLTADCHISDERFADALKSAEQAVAENPKDEEALARLAAANRLLVNPTGALAAELVALANNPKPATFYSALGERLADRRKYQPAERAFLLATAADPERADARIGLGMLYMQIGREPEAKALFDAAFAADPFNVRADNMMKVLKRLAGYTAHETDHFVITVDEAQDSLHAKYMSRFLEKVFGGLTERFGYAPPEKTQIEILKDHQTFSGRTVALPFIPTVGACTGKVVALASPRDGKRPFNWSRVLIHEVTHVITLQQTEFNIPHWYTEALAVESEDTPRPQQWNKMLLERVPDRKLLNLDTINLGFIRPKEAEERSLAYCQAQLYAQYMVERFGPESLAKMLMAYRRGLTTDRAIKACFDVDKKDFEDGYLTFLDKVIKTIRTRVDEEEPMKPSEIALKLRKTPDDPDLNAKMAYDHFARREYKEARPFADKALKAKPHHPLASYVKARLFLFIGDKSSAMEVLEPALDPERPDERVVDLLAEMLTESGRLEDAERLYEMARKDDPYHSKWIAGLARVHLRQKDTGKLIGDLAMLAANDADDLDVRRTLAEYNLKLGHAPEAEKWATECLYIQVYDVDNHVLLADALAEQKKYPEAAEEYAVALELKPKKTVPIRVKLARALAGAGRNAEAKAALDDALAADPDNPDARKLSDELGGKP